MACKDCKKKNKAEVPKDTVKIDKLERFAKIFLFVWSLFALFGIYSFINLFL